MQRPGGSPLLLSALVLLLAPGFLGAPETPASSLRVPPAAPTGEPTDWCGTGRLSAAEYQASWTHWRAVAAQAERQQHRQCQGLALAQLAMLTENQDLGYLGAPYWRGALLSLEEVLAPTDPRLGSAMLSLARAMRGGDVQVRERLLLASITVFEGAVMRPHSMAPLACPLARQPDPPIHAFTADLHAGSAAEHRRLLSAAQLELAGLRLQARRPPEALQAALAAQRHLELRFEIEGPSSTTSTLTLDASRLVGILLELPPALVEAEELRRAVDLVRRAAPASALYQGSALQSLAAYHRSRRELDRAEEALGLALRLHDELARRSRAAAKSEQPIFASRQILVYDLAAIYELQQRWEDLEELHLEALAAAEEQGEPTKDELQSLVYFHRGRRRWDDAVSSLRRLEALDSRGWHVHEQLGRDLFELGRWREAEAELLSALELLRPQVAAGNSNLVPPLLLLARIYHRDGRTAAADAALAEAAGVYDAALAEKDQANVAWISLGGKGRVMMEARRFDEAEALYRRAEAAIAGRAGAHPADRVGPLLGRMMVAVRRGRSDQAAALLAAAAGVCQTAMDAEATALERCLRQTAEAAREAGLEGPAADLLRRADAATAWARGGAAPKGRR